MLPSPSTRVQRFSGDRRAMCEAVKGMTVFEAIAALRASRTWHTDIGRPEGAGWVAGSALVDATTGPFAELLARIGRQAATRDRRTIAASFAMRLGWASEMAIAPALGHDCVPDVGLDNVSFHFAPSTALDRMAIHEPRGEGLADDPSGTLQALRHALTRQSTPVVEALFAWAGFSRRGTWGLLASAWAAKLAELHPTPSDHRAIQRLIEAFFAGSDVLAAMQPQMRVVDDGRTRRLVQRRASCCRIYLLPGCALCVSCPLVPQAPRRRTP
jgi:hypothetical protein